MSASDKETGTNAGLMRRDFLKVGTAMSGSLLVGQNANPATAAEGEGTLHVEIRDGLTKETVSAMVCVTSLADHKWRIPPDGRRVPPVTNVHDIIYAPFAWKPGDIGPVRATNGEYYDNEVRSLAYSGRAAYPFWKEPATYFVSKPFSISLPAGKWRLAVARGLEYVPIFKEFEIAPGADHRQEVLLRRWVDMPRLGWYSGDNHVHVPRTTPEHNEFLITWARAEDIHVSNILSFTELQKLSLYGREHSCEQVGYGKDFRYQQGDYVLASGQEDSSMEIHEQGHSLALNITDPVHPPDRFHLYDIVFDAVHAQGGLAGYAHFAWAAEYYRNPYVTWDATINVVRGKVDFLEILQFRHFSVNDYYDFLNLGYKLTASAGSDLPWGNTIGEVRTYVHAGKNFSADAWFDAMKAGHTFVTNGPMLKLTVNDAIPGDELKIAANTSLRIRARTWAPSIIGSPKTLELIAQGEVIRSAESKNSDKEELKVDVVLKAGESQWIAARVEAHNGAVAHTSPIYVFVDGRSFRNEKELPQLVEKRMKILDFVANRLRDEKFVSNDSYTHGEIEALNAEISEARRRYEQLLSAAHG